MTTGTATHVTSLNDLYKPDAQDHILLSQKMIHQVDYSKATNNFLFRGNLPVDGQNFDYDSLVSYLRNVASPSLPATFKIVDVCLLWQFIPKDFIPLEVEKIYWKANPDKGWFINEPIFGSLLPPPADATERNLEEDIGGATLYDHHDDHVQSIKSLLDNSGDNAKGENIAIYIHCDAGKDRTGEVTAAYEMTYLGKSYKTVMTESQQVAGREINVLNQHAIKWYAYHMQSKIPTIGQID
jgi:hypothetical protein